MSEQTRPSPVTQRFVEALSTVILANENPDPAWAIPDGDLYKSQTAAYAGITHTLAACIAHASRTHGSHGRLSAELLVALSQTAFYLGVTLGKVAADAQREVEDLERMVT